jgi:YidC/Oxa1 family membrane protein insertase
MELFDKILFPIKVVVAWIMVGFHAFFSALGLDPAGGAAWALSIVGLVIVIRIILIPLFVRQIRAQRGLQLISPELQAIQKKYKGKTDPASREAMSRETMELYRKHGTNPFASCLPILAQSPIFFALFRVLYNLPRVAAGNYPTDGAGQSIGPITPSVAEHATNATIFGAPISSTFLSPDATTATRVVSVVLIVLMSVTTFTTQRQLTQKNMPASALQGPMAQQQKMLLYVLPLVFAVSGVNFPIGVLIYWTTTNLWSMGQQFYVIRRNPTPGSEAERLLKERQARKAAAKGIVLEEERPAIEEKPRGQRQQPKRKDRAKGGQRPAAATSPTDGPVDDVQDSSDEFEAPAPPARKGPRPGAAPKGSAQRGGAAPGRGSGGASQQRGAPKSGGKAGGARPSGSAAAGQSKGQRPSGAAPRGQKSGSTPSGRPAGSGGAKRPSRGADGSSAPSTDATTGQTPPSAKPRRKPTASSTDGSGSGAATPPRKPRPPRQRKPSDSSDTDQ